MSILSKIFKAISFMQDTVDVIENDILKNAQTGDYVKTIFLWYFSKKPSPIRDDSAYPHYFSYECGIQRASEYHKHLLHEGYFTETTTDESLNTITVSELKKVLKHFELSIKGKKSELIQRITENVPKKFIAEMFNSKLYSLSDKGKEFLGMHEDYVKLHQHSYLEIRSTEYDVEHENGFSFYDTVWRILNKRILQDRSTFGRHELLKMYQLLDEEDRQSEALMMLLRVLYIDLSGSKENLLPFAPGIITGIEHHGQAFSEEMIEQVYQWNLPRKTCSKELFAKFVRDIINKNFDEENAKKELRKDKRKPKSKI